jgi:hypothetical protein
MMPNTRKADDEDGCFSSHSLFTGMPVLHSCVPVERQRFGLILLSRFKKQPQKVSNIR